MVSFRKQRSQRNQIGCKVTFRNGFGRRQVHNGKTAVWMCLDISCCVKSLCFDPSPPALRQKRMDQSFFKISLSSHPIIPFSGGGSQGAVQAQTVSAFYTSYSSLVPLLLLIPPRVLVLHDPRTQEFLQFFVSTHTLFKLTLFSPCFSPAL